jgi:hypothetical protein
MGRYYDRESGRADAQSRERDERRFRLGGRERGRYEVPTDWDRDRYRDAPEYGRDESYGWSGDLDGGRYDAERHLRDPREYWRARANAPWQRGEDWDARDAWRRGGPRGYEYGPNENRYSDHRFRELPERNTLRGVGGPNDPRFTGSAFPEWDHWPDAERWTRRGGFAGKGPRGYARSDDRMREDVCERLSQDDEVDASDVTVTVVKGEVTLEGTVPDRHSKRRAEDIAESVAGVTDVHNRLRANKGFVEEMSDKLMGRANESGHTGSGTRNAPAGPGMQNNH